MADAGQSSRSPSCSCNRRNSVREKFIRLVRRGVFFQFVQAGGDELRHGAPAAQARIIRQAVRAFAPDESRQKRQHGQACAARKTGWAIERDLGLSRAFPDFP